MYVYAMFVLLLQTYNGYLEELAFILINIMTHSSLKTQAVKMVFYFQYTVVTWQF